jgi:CDP-diacylglycerol--serine O-phosphatidyltransferase
MHELRRRTFRGFELRKALFILPNAFTIASIGCGLYAILVGASADSNETLYRSALAVFFAGFFDLFDGRIARLTRTQSDFGVQLDSLADIISFGVAPAIIMYKWALAPLGTIGMIGAFCFTSCGAIRLARFNVLAARETKAKDYFVGLPIPLAASMLIAMVMAHYKLRGELPVESHYLVLAMVLVLSVLMVSAVKYWSFKEFHFTLKWAVLSVALGLMITYASLRFTMSVTYVALISGYIVAGLGRATYHLFTKKPLH